jgi:CBS domain-containing protein
MAKKVHEAMTVNPKTAEPSSSAIEAARLMRDEDVGSLPVIDQGELIGMVTDRDITIRVVAEGKDPQKTTVGEIVSRQLVTIDLEQDLDEALELMAIHQVRRLPVVEADVRLVGILAQADVALEAKDKKAGQLLEEISQPTTSF